MMMACACMSWRHRKSRAWRLLLGPTSMVKGEPWLILRGIKPGRTASGEGAVFVRSGRACSSSDGEMRACAYLSIFIASRHQARLNARREMYMHRQVAIFTSLYCLSLRVCHVVMAEAIGEKPIKSASRNFGDNGIGATLPNRRTRSRQQPFNGVKESGGSQRRGPCRQEAMQKHRQPARRNGAALMARGASGKARATGGAQGQRCATSAIGRHVVWRHGAALALQKASSGSIGAGGWPALKRGVWHRRWVHWALWGRPKIKQAVVGKRAGR